MPLTTYDETRPWARAIKEQVVARRMPKWQAARGVGAFRNDFTLTPFEIALIVSWVDGGLPKGADAPRAAVALPQAAAATPDSDAVSVVVPARADLGRTALDAPLWVTGWTFEPGDPLITAAVVSFDGVSAGDWVAGDAPTALPAGMAFKATRRIRVDVRRRAASDYERPFTPRRSVLTLATSSIAPMRRAWTEQVNCGAVRSGAAARLIGIRPLLDRPAARLWITRAGAPVTLLGWFRDFDALYPRTYWLLRDVDLDADARLQGDVPCKVELTLVGAP